MSEEEATPVVVVAYTAEAEVLYDASPATLPNRTYFPAVVSLGLVLLFWGFLTSPIIAIAGLGLLGVGVAGWIEELLREGRDTGGE